MKSSPIGFPKPKKQTLSDYQKAQKYWESHRADQALERQYGVAKKLILRRKGKVLRKKRIKLPSTRKLILKADAVFSMFIRNRDKRCVLCLKTVQLTCGHLIKRGKKAVRWDEANCNCLCMGCNYKDNFEHDHYVVWWINKYSPLKYEQMVERSKGIFKPSRDYLNDLIKKYENKG